MLFSSTIWSSCKYMHCMVHSCFLTEKVQNISRPFNLNSASFVLKKAQKSSKIKLTPYHLTNPSSNMKNIFAAGAKMWCLHSRCNTKLPNYTRRSTTVSLESYPLYSMFIKFCFVLRITSANGVAAAKNAVLSFMPQKFPNDTGIVAVCLHLNLYA